MSIPSGWHRVPGTDGKYAIDHQSGLLRISRVLIMGNNRYSVWLLRPGKVYEYGESFDHVGDASKWAESKLSAEEKK